MGFLIRKYTQSFNSFHKSPEWLKSKQRIRPIIYEYKDTQCTLPIALEKCACVCVFIIRNYGADNLII